MTGLSDNPLFLALAATCAIYLAVGVRRHPRAAVVIWLSCTVLVPVWLQLDLGVTLQPLSVLAVCLLPSIIHNWRGRLRNGDRIIIAFAAAATLGWMLFDTPQFAWVAVFTQWGAAYLVGRSLGPAAGEQWITRAMAVAGSLVGAWAIIEFAFALHVFEGFAAEIDTARWNEIQERGSFARSEAAFGHSIAMGGFLSLCVPFVIATTTTVPRRVLMLTLILGGTVVSFSRGPVIGAALAIVLSLVFLSKTSLTRRARIGLIALTAAASLFVVPLVWNTFASVSSDLTGSADYRSDLAATFLPDLVPLGLANGVSFLGERQMYRQFTSIDNAFALVGLQLGWVPLAILILGALGLVMRLIRGQAGSADVSMVAQLAVLFTVALITQYGVAVFFVVGLAVGLSNSRPSPRTPPQAAGVARGRPRVA